ncbi:MAG: flippase [Candidatus Latescibacteria bacterium]|nr:flippase [Candidatus Latescibacterota bacterium]
MSDSKTDSAGQTIARNAAFLLIARALSTVLGLILVLFMARNLGDQEFGIYTIGIACGGISHIFVDLGLNNLTTRQLARHPESADVYLGQVLLIKLSLFVPVLVGTYVLLSLFQYEASTLQVVMIVVANALLFNALHSFYYHIFEGFEQMQYITSLEVVKRLTYMVSGVAAIYAGYGVFVFVILLVISDALNLGLAWLICRRNFPVRIKLSASVAGWFKLIKTGLPFGLLVAFSMILSSTDIVMLGAFRTEQEAGWYGASIRLISTLTMIPLMAASAMFPSISRLFHEAPEQLASIFADVIRPLVLLALPIAVGTSMLSEPIIRLLYSSEYIAGAPALGLLVWSVALHFLALPMIFFLSAVDRQVYATTAMGVGAAINVLLNVILIPKMGLVGASITTIASQLVLLAACFISIKGMISVVQVMRFGVQSAVASVGLWLYLTIDPAVHVLLSVAAGGVVYLALLIVIRAVGRDDWDRCMGIFRTT